MEKRIGILVEKQKLPIDVYKTLMEFSVAYLKETPRDISEFGIKFFVKKESERIRALKIFENNEPEKSKFSPEKSKNSPEKSRYSPVKNDTKTFSFEGKGSKIMRYGEEGVKNIRRAVELLSNVGIFKYLTNANISKLAENLTHLNFKDGELVFREGDDICGIILVDSGIIQLSTAQLLSPIKILHMGKTILRSCDYTDVLSLACSKPSSFTGFAKGEVNCYYLDTASFEKVLGPCCFYIHRAHRHLEWENYIQGNPYLYMLRYELRNFLICYMFQKPENFILFSLNYFKEMKETPGQIGFSMNETKVKERHPGIGGTGHYQHERNDGVPKFPNYSKSTKQRNLLKAALTKILIFKPMEDKELNTIIDSMKRRDVQKEEVILNLGDGEDSFFVIESGLYDAYIIRNGIEEVVQTYDGEGCFGELAMMYHTPRNATVRAKTDGIIWGLPKDVFRAIVLGNGILKRKLYENLIEEVPILKSLNSMERANLADSIQARKFSPGEVIIRENETADGMYFIISGKVVIKKEDKGEEIHIRTIDKGGYFGELALVTQSRRAASAYALTEVDAAFLDVEAFEKILGPSKHILRRNIELYKRQIFAIISNMDESKSIQ